MVGKNRVPMQVSPVFEDRIKKIQREIMKIQGMNISLREITEKVVKTPSFEDVEKSILKLTNQEFRINLDRRKK